MRRLGLERKRSSGLIPNAEEGDGAGPARFLPFLLQRQRHYFLHSLHVVHLHLADLLGL
jgi:hypothetical protein